MFCLYCGNVLPEDALFCNKCGRQQNVVADIRAPSSAILPTIPTLLGNGQPLAQNLPVAQGTPQAGSVPIVQGTPPPLAGAPAEQHALHLTSPGSAPSWNPQAS